MPPPGRRSRPARTRRTAGPWTAGPPRPPRNRTTPRCTCPPGIPRTGRPSCTRSRRRSAPGQAPARTACTGSRVEGVLRRVLDVLAGARREQRRVPRRRGRARPDALADVPQQPPEILDVGGQVVERDEQQHPPGGDQQDPDRQGNVTLLPAA